MDEIVFRSSQKLETFQLQLELVASKMKDLIQTCSQQSKVLFIQAWNSTKADQLKEHIKELISHLVSAVQEFKERALDIADPKRFYMFLASIFGKEWSKRDVCFACAGFFIGGLVGITVGLAIRKREPIIRYMQAIQCTHYLGPESAIVVEDAIAPYECGDYDVLVNVKAASVQIIDAQICSGYGKNLRRILRRIYKQSTSDLPVILGRDCTGIVTDLGPKVKRLEVGDEVWLTVPFWSQGTLCQTILVSESRISRKPKNIGFEGACSLPYAGSLALSALTEANISYSSAQNKRILIQGGCTPVGCVLIQILNHWKANVTTTCYKRAVPVATALGAANIIVLSEPTNKTQEPEDTDNKEEVNNALLKELEINNIQFDVIFVTKEYTCDINMDDLSMFCGKDGKIISTLPPPLFSDSCGYCSRLLLSAYIRIKYILQKALGLPLTDFDETHLCHVSLDKLTEFVEDGYLQTVVDKVFHPQDIEIALNHIQSSQSIGSTIITYR